MYVVNEPPVVMWSTSRISCSTNHRFPSGPGAMPSGSSLLTVYSVVVPDVVILPTLPVDESVYHRFLSDPVVIANGLLPLGSAYSVSCAAGCGIFVSVSLPVVEL